MRNYDWNKLLVDRGLMTSSEEIAFSEKHRIYYQANYDSNGSLINKSEMEPYFGKPHLHFHGRKHQYLTFRHPSIVDLIYAISNGTPEIVQWSSNQSAKHSLIICQPHNGVFFAKAWMARPLGNYAWPVLKLLSSHTEVLSVFSMSNDDPCSYQRWKEGKCARAIEWIPHPTTFGKLVDFGTAEPNDPTYDNNDFSYMDVNRALEKTGHAGHHIPPLKSKDEEVLAWKVYLPDILK